MNINEEQANRLYCTICGKILEWEKLANFANLRTFVNVYLLILPPVFYPPNIFPCTVIKPFKSLSL